MNILVLGSGGREHALAWKLHQSQAVENLFVAPGNAGTAEFAENIPLAVSDFEAIREAVLSRKIDLVLVGPEVPLVMGIQDYFKSTPSLANIALIGPSKIGAQLEGSKEFAKKFMERHGIPTAAYRSFGVSDLEDAYRFLESIPPPYVLKADGLAAGKGVLILNEIETAKSELQEMLVEAKFGAASSRVVIEAFLSGIELSCFVLTDGKDYKRIGEGDTGLNTGGMGAISPVGFADATFMEKVESRIIKPTVEGLKKENIPYTGFIFIGLIKVGDDPFVIEYNVRMGDPETEVVIPRIQTDLADLLKATADGTLKEIDLEIHNEAAATVMMVSGGYPEAYQKGYPIRGLDSVKEATVFHAGTQRDSNGAVVTSGGRVIAVTALGADFKECLRKTYKGVSEIQFQDAYYRTDIGFDL